MLMFGRLYLTEWIESRGLIPGFFITNCSITKDKLSDEVITYREVATYAEMLALKVKVKTDVLVAFDSDKGQNNTRYELWPSGVRLWVASVKDN